MLFLHTPVIALPPCLDTIIPIPVLTLAAQQGSKPNALLYILSNIISLDCRIMGPLPCCTPLPLEAPVLTLTGIDHLKKFGSPEYHISLAGDVLYGNFASL